MANASQVPVINGCDEKYHPCQAISDLMTMKEKKGSLKGLHLVYIGIHNNVCNSLIEGCTKTGVKITTVTPLFNEPSRDEELLEHARESGLYESTLNIKETVKEADFVYTDSWIDMEFFLNSKYAVEKERRVKLMMPYQIRNEMFQESEAYVMHDMPIHRGYEINEEMVESERSIIYEQSENRLYSAKAILLKTLGVS
jgi:ornithine carbamoyltransferase